MKLGIGSWGGQFLTGHPNLCSGARSTHLRQPRPSSPGREPWGTPSGDRGDILVPSLTAVTKPTSKSNRRLEGFDVAHGMQLGMQESLVAGRSMRWRLGSQLASSGFTLSVCICEFVHTCARVVCEGSRSQSLILI